MEFLTAAIMTVAGLFVLGWSGDKLVDGASKVAHRLKLSDVFVGIIIVGFGTSLPEMVSSASAVMLGSPDLALGNIVGSNIANVGLIMAFALLMARGQADMTANRTDFLLMLAALVLMSGTLWLHGGIDATTGSLLLIVLASYLYLSMRIGKSAPAGGQGGHINTTWLMLSLLVIGGLIGLLLGANLLVNGATTLARLIGVPEKVIGITLVAIGTSLPELAAAIAAARVGNLGLTVGNILGSNVFNALGVAGFAALFAPLSLGTFTPDLWVMLAFAVALMPIFLWRRAPAALLGLTILAGYCVYTLALFWPCLLQLICKG